MLFKAYPEAAEIQDNFGWLPLHYALQYQASNDVINMLFQAYPQSIEVKTKNSGRLPLHIALEQSSSEDVINMLLQSCLKAAKI